MDNRKNISENSEEYEDYFGFISDFKKRKEGTSYVGLKRNVDLPQGYSEQQPTVEEQEESANDEQEESVHDEQEESLNGEEEESVHDEQEESFSIEESDSGEDYRLNPKILWNKREYFYSLDQTTREKIWRVFEWRVKSAQRPSVVDKDLNEDAFYSTYGVTPSYDIAYLKEDSYIKRILSCENLRILNIQFLHYNSLNCKEIERYVQLYRNDPVNQVIYKAIILQRKRIEFLLNKARNYISEITLMGEEAYSFIEKVYYIVFKKSNRLEQLSCRSM